MEGESSLWRFLKACLPACLTACLSVCAYLFTQQNIYYSILLYITVTSQGIVINYVFK
jgi:hypothetical protein